MMEPLAGVIRGLLGTKPGMYPRHVWVLAVILALNGLAIAGNLAVAGSLVIAGNKAPIEIPPSKARPLNLADAQFQTKSENKALKPIKPRLRIIRKTGSTGMGSTKTGSTGMGSIKTGSTGMGSTKTGSTGMGSTKTGSTGMGSTKRGLPTPQEETLHKGTIMDGQPPTFVLIMDDMGLHWERGLKALALPGPITYAFLPYRSHVQALAEYANKLNKEIMLHMPMSNIRNQPLGEGGLTVAQDERTLKSRLASAIAAVPYVKGVNNHMGSELTSDARSMAWVMDTVRQKGLYFVDSRTSSDSIAYETAHQYRVRTLMRDLFLDHDRDLKAINRQFNKALERAKVHGSVVVIAHPYPETLDFLASALPKLTYLGFSQATVSGMLHLAQTQKLYQQALAADGSLHKDSLNEGPAHKPSVPDSSAPISSVYSQPGQRLDTLVETLRRQDVFNGTTTKSLGAL